MEFAFTQEQEELRREARSFLERNTDAPLSALRELGWLGVSVPEERGGGGLSFVDEAILFEECPPPDSKLAQLKALAWGCTPPRHSSAWSAHRRC